MNRTYECKNIKINWLDLNLSSGWGPDAFLSITQNEDLINRQYGADGQMAPSKNSNRGAVIELTLMQTSEVNDQIGEYAAAQMIVGNELQFAPFIVTDDTGQSVKFVADNALLVDSPDHEFGLINGTKTWVWECETFIDGADAATTVANLQSYLA